METSNATVTLPLQEFDILRKEYRMSEEKLTFELIKFAETAAKAYEQASLYNFTNFLKSNATDLAHKILTSQI